MIGCRFQYLALWAQHIHGQLTQLPVPAGPEQFINQRLPLQGTIAAGLAGEHAHGVVTHDLQFGVGLGYALAQGRVLGCTVTFSDFYDLIKFILELHLLAQGGDTSLKAQQSHSHLPAFTWGAHDVVGSTHCIVKKHFIEFTGAGHLLDRAHLYTGLIHLHQKKAQAFVGTGIGIGAGQHKAVIRLLRQ